MWPFNFLLRGWTWTNVFQCSIQFSNTTNHIIWGTMHVHIYMSCQSIGVCCMLCGQRHCNLWYIFNTTTQSVNILYAIWLEALWYLSLCLHYYYVRCTQVIWIGRTTERKELSYIPTWSQYTTRYRNATQRNTTHSSMTMTPHHRPYFQGREGGEVQGYI
jgi:hypothetical protein